MPFPVKSAARSLQVLALFDLLKRPAGIVEISHELGYPASSTSVLIKTLCEMGYLSRDPFTHKFAPTIQLAMLGRWVKAGHADGHMLATLAMQTQNATGCSAVLSRRHGLNVQYVHVERMVPQDFSSRRPNTGALRPICTSAAGFVLLADEPDDKIGLIVRNAKALQNSTTDLPTLLAHLEATRRDGYGWQADSNSVGVGDVAVRIPVKDSFGHGLALSVGASSSLIRREHEVIGETLKQLVREFAAQVEAQQPIGPFTAHAE